MDTNNTNPVVEETPAEVATEDELTEETPVEEVKEEASETENAENVELNQ